MHPTYPLPWLAGSVALALLAANLGWWVVRRGVQVRPVAGLLHWSGLPAVGWLFFALFLLLPPAAAWQMGALSPYWMGLAELDWVNSLGTGLWLAGLICGLTLFGWLAYRRSAPPLAAAIPRWLPVLNAALLQWHWAFYRAASIGVLGTWAAAASTTDGWPATALAHSLASASDLSYWGSWTGLALAAVEWLLNPFSRADIREGRGEEALRAAALAVATTALFVLTRNFWLGLACHVAIEIAIALLQRTSQVS